ncbi:MAG: HD domain-containing phosphohydrolase [bacterium]
MKLPEHAKILIIDDEPANVRLLERLLQQEGFVSLKSATDPRQALPLYTEFQPDLILLDLHMPHLDGFAVMNQLRPRIREGEYLPILVLTADVATETKLQALSIGAVDFLTKPLDHAEVRLRIRNLLQTRFLYKEVQNQKEVLEDKVRERTADLEQAQLEALERLALAAEFRDDETGQHTQRVGVRSAMLAKAVGLPPDRVELIRRAAPLHDVGKIGIPDGILRKPSKLTPEEFEVMKTHTTIGAKILSGSRSPLLQMAEEIALTHHEHWDGGGYAGLAGATIPLPGRIVALADVFDALTNDRIYRKALSLEETLTEIERQRELQFDPTLVDAFLRITREPGIQEVPPLSRTA